MHRRLLRAAKEPSVAAEAAGLPPPPPREWEKRVGERLCSCILDGVLSLFSLNEVI